MTTPSQSPYRPHNYSPNPPPAFYQRKRTTPLMIALLAVAGLIVVAGLGALGLVLLGNLGTASTANDAVAVTVDQCREAGGFYEATVTVANNGTRPRTVLVDIEWSDRSSGTRLATATVTVASVDAGQAAKELAATVGPDTSALLQCTYRIR